MVITAEPDSQRDHHYMTRMPTWISLQDQEANVVISAGPGSQPVMATLAFWSSSDDHVGCLVLQ
jgi:hypothetical protein